MGFALVYSLWSPGLLVYKLEAPTPAPESALQLEVEFALVHLAWLQMNSDPGLLAFELAPRHCLESAHRGLLVFSLESALENVLEYVHENVPAYVLE